METDFSFQKVVLPQLIAKRQLAGFVSDHKYFTLSDLKRLPITEEALRPRKIIFLDRDGVIRSRVLGASGDARKMEDAVAVREVLPYKDNRVAAKR
jgi:hypothetical protein